MARILATPMAGTRAIELSTLPETPTVSGIMPIVDDIDFPALTMEFAAYSQKRFPMTLLTRGSAPTFPNSRGDIEYAFNSGRVIMTVRGDVSEATWLRILFFMAHGIGHARQNSDPAHWQFVDQYVQPASSTPGSRTMEELIDWQGEARSFAALFTSHERDATSFGWSAIEDFVSNSRYAPFAEEIRFWYGLFGIVDHLYHRQSITGPFPTQQSEWLAVFGQKLEAVVLPFSLTHWRDNEIATQPRFACVYVGTDGLFHSAEGPFLGGLACMRDLFRDRIIDPFPNRFEASSVDSLAR